MRPVEHRGPCSIGDGGEGGLREVTLAQHSTSQATVVSQPPPAIGDPGRLLQAPPIVDPPDGSSSPQLVRGTLAFLASFCGHLVLLLVLALIPLVQRGDVSVVLIETMLEPEPEVTESFAVSETVEEFVGALSSSDANEALALAAEISPVSVVPSQLEIEPVIDARVEIQTELVTPSSPHFHETIRVRGGSGHGVTGVAGAMDRITQEILLSLEERPTIVVWIFDQSASLYRQRRWLQQRVERIYQELGVARQSGHEAFRGRDEQPLLTSVMAFGKEVEFKVNLTADVARIKRAIASIEMDPSGIELVFTAIHRAADRYRRYRYRADGGEPQRNVMLVVFTDEAGNDQDGLDPTVSLCRKYAMPVYVVGAPAPFGRRRTVMKWIDPDPQYSQRPQWVEIEQGPESLRPERLKLYFSGSDRSDPVIDSGFGPFSLTRLCVETGGIFFTAHPNRQLGRKVTRRETEALTAHIEKFFDPKLMKRYQPDYVPASVYISRLRQNRARAALVKASQVSWIAPLQSPRLRFIKRDEPSFAREITEAQKGPAKLEPQVEAIYAILKQGEPDRAKEESPRWQAGFDLAMGRALAILVRTQSYNAMLAKAKRGLKFRDPRSNTWTLEPSNEITVNTRLRGAAEKARNYLQRVVDEHPGTPWAYLAQRELAIPLGWTWKESFTNLNPPRRPRAAGGNNNRPRRPLRNEQPRRIKPTPPKRKPPAV